MSASIHNDISQMNMPMNIALIVKMASKGWILADDHLVLFKGLRD